VQPSPNLGKEGSLISKGHFAFLAVVELLQVAQSLLDVIRALLAYSDVLIDGIQGLAGIAHGLYA